MRRAALALALALALPAGALAAPPTISYTLDGPTGADGWFTGPVRVTWTVAADDATCPAVETLRDDTTGTARSCTASNADGSTTVQTKVIKIDQTPPIAVTGAAARAPDHGLFYIAPVAVAFAGTDATSGVAACTTATYGGPDAPTATVSGTCRDRAGNASPPTAFAFAYDATAPALTGLTATVDAARRATLSWTPAPDAQAVTVTREGAAAPLLDHAPASTRTLTDGPLPAGATATYAVTLADAAGNATTATATATVPPSAATAAKRPATPARPTLRWRAQPHAKYYNLQLFRGGRKVFSAWPRRNRYTLRASWRFHGKTYKLTSGRYRWYVWPGYGPRARHRYGALHAKGAVTYPAPPIRDGGQ